jgi:CRISPR-associated protein Csd2
MSTTDFNCGQVRGPVQITFARSIDRVLPTNHSITRIAFTSENRARKTRGTSEMGRKHTVAYGLYRAHGFINAAFAAQTGFSEADLDLLWKALSNMLEIDRSAARGFMSARGLFAFRRNSTLGDAHAHELFRRIAINLKPGVETPRTFDDYAVSADDRKLPAGVTLLPLISGSD